METLWIPVRLRRCTPRYGRRNACGFSIYLVFFDSQILKGFELRP